MADNVSVVQDYHSAAHVITEPDKYVACSRYFVRRWMPLLGNEGTRIVLALRSLGFHNPGTGETRNGIEIELTELAAMIGVHVATLKREFGDVKGQPGVPTNPVLQKFVRKEKQYWRDPVTNRLLRTANIYRVMMDDPLHEDDLPRLNEILASREKGADTSKAQNAPQMPKSKKGQPSEAQNAPRRAQNAPCKAQNAHQKAQNAPALKDYSSSLTNTSSTAALPGDCASLFEESTELEQTPARRWQDLAAAEQQPYIEQARAELAAVCEQSGATPNLQLVEARGRNLYRLAHRE